MPASKKTGRLTPDKTIPKGLAKQPSKTTYNVLQEFEDFVAKCKVTVNAKIKSLNDSGRTDPVVHKRAADNTLIDQFRGCKWAP